MEHLRLSCVLMFLCVLCGHFVYSQEGVNPSRCIIWGPGLKSAFVVPARYFYIQAVDIEGNNITKSVGEDAFSVNIFSKIAGTRVRVWPGVLDRKDGSYIVRFKLFDSYKDLHVEVFFQTKHVANSPYFLEGDVYNEKCDCPVSSMKMWLENMECPSSYREIKKDLSLFKSVDMQVVAKDLVERFSSRPGSHSLCHYVVKNNKIFRKTYGEHVGFKMFMDSILLSMTRKVKLPDLELFVNLGDWPLEKRSVRENPMPIFSWCGSDDTHDIIMPTYDVTESTLQTMGRCDEDLETLSIEMPTYEASEESLQSACRVTLDLMSVQGNTGPRWENKSSIAFFRGRDSREERLEVVRLSRKHPDLIDAKLTNMFFFKHSEDLGELVKHISFFDFFKHKYQINIDGTVAAYRLPYLMAGNSVIFKQQSPYYEHFYKRLVPYKHYIPFKRDLSDLLQQIKWAKDHDEEAKTIALNAQEFVRENLMAKDIFCYHALLFEEYAKRLIHVPQVLDDMEEVPQPEDHETGCQCNRNTKEKDEL